MAIWSLRASGLERHVRLLVIYSWARRGLVFTLAMKKDRLLTEVGQCERLRVMRAQGASRFKATSISQCLLPDNHFLPAGRCCFELIALLFKSTVPTWPARPETGTLVLRSETLGKAGELGALNSRHPPDGSFVSLQPSRCPASSCAPLISYWKSHEPRDMSTLIPHSISPVMDSHLHYARATTAFTTADRLIRTEKDRKAVRDIWIFLASVLAFFTLVNLVRKLSTKLHHPQRSSPPASPSDVEKTEARLPGKQLASRLTRVSSAVATSFRIVAFRWAIPIGPNALATVSELACICLYIAANLLWLFLDTRHLSVNFYKSRAALMSCAQLPLVVALASKNNVISWMTGVSHEKLNVLHRAAGRTMFLMLWIHTIGRAVSGLPPKVQYHDYFMQAGIIGLAALTAGVFLSVRIFRQALFEFFFVTHIAFMLMFLIGGYIHLHEQGYDFYIWPSLLVWGLDRLFRALRLLWHNTFRLNESAKSQAIAELLTEDTIRLTFKRKFHWKPGQHAYVSLPKISRLPSEAHPFTIASLPGNPDGTQSEENSVVFLIRTRSGVTRRLREFASKTATNSVAAYIDGPYGSPPNLHPFSTCVLVAGGSGISYTLPLLLDLIRQSSVGGRSEVRRVLFVWVFRSDGHLPWITEALSKALSASKQALDVEVRLYVTKANVAPGMAWPSGSSNSVSRYEKNEVFPEPESSGNAPHIHHGRPDITTLLHDEISASSGPVSVDVAGPGALTASVREALSTGVASPGAVLKGTASVTLHVETFGMIQS